VVVDPATCRWSEEQAKGLITFLIAEKKQLEQKLQKIERTIQRLKREYNLTDTDIYSCEEFAWLFVEF